MVESFEKVLLEEMIFSKITEASLKKLFVTNSFLAVYQVSMLQKSLGLLGPVQIANMWKIKPVFAVISKISIFQSRISSSFISSYSVYSLFSQKVAV